MRSFMGVVGGGVCIGRWCLIWRLIRGRGEFGDDLFRYLMDALRADGVGRRGVREVLSGMPRGVYWERDGDGGAKVEEDTDVEDHSGVEDDHTGVQDYTKVEDYTDGGDETESTVEDDVVTETGTEIEIEADVEVKQESESEAETK